MRTVANAGPAPREALLLRAIEIGRDGMLARRGGPFGALIAGGDGSIVAEGCNEVTSTNDPTAHAEIMAIRGACAALGTFTLAGHFLGADEAGARFAPDLAETMAWGDARYRDLAHLFSRTATDRGLPPPQLPEPEPFDGAAPTLIPLDGFGAVIFAGGFRPDYTSWLPWPEAFDSLGFPIQADGASTVVDGLHFVGVPFMRTRKSPLLIGVGEDAAVVASSITGGAALAWATADPCSGLGS